MTSKKGLRKYGRWLGVLVLAGLLVPAARAQTGEDALRMTQRFPAIGARMVGIGGAGIAGVADPAALFTNPAGLAYYTNSELAGALSSLSTTEEARFFPPGADPNLADRDIRDTQLGSVAYVYRAPTVRGSFVAAVGYNQVNSFDRNFVFSGLNNTNSITDSFLPYADEFEVREDDAGYYPVFFNPIPELAYRAGAIEFLFENVGTSDDLFYQAVAPGTTLEQAGDVIEEGRMSELSFGGAVEASKNVMVGLSANLVFGSYRFDNQYNELDVQNETTEDDYEVILDDGSLFGFQELRYNTGFESDLTGFNLRAGVSTEVAPSVRLGLSLETPTFYTVSESYFSELETVFDVGGSLFDESRGQFEYEITTPWRLGGGVAYDGGSFLITGDVEYVDWSQLELDASGEDFTDVNRSIRENLEPVFNTRAGLEYRLGNLALRGGLALQPDPRSFDIEFEEGSTDRSRTYYSAGVGYQFAEQFAIDFGWTQERFDDFYEPYGDVATTPPAVEEEVVRNRFLVGVRVTF